MDKRSHDLLTRLVANAERPFEQANVAPREIYTDPGFLSLEIEQLFHKRWMLVGHADQIAQPGDYFTYDIVDQPIVIFRQPDGAVRAFGNSCLHRYAKLVEGSGNKARFTCGYHGWTYDLEGRLVTAPYMEKRDGFSCEGKQLPEIACEIWNGFVFLSLNPHPDPLAAQLGGLQKRLKNYALHTFQNRNVNDDLFECNWKALFENFNESYHLFQTHRDSIGEFSPTALVSCDVGDPEAYILHYTPYAEEQTAFNSTLTGEDRQRVLLIGLFPAAMLALSPDNVWWMSLQPDGPERVRTRWGLAYSPDFLAADENADAVVAEWEAVINRVNGEDKAMLKRLQQGTKFRTDIPGTYHPMERVTFEFNQYLASKLSQ